MCGVWKSVLAAFAKKGECMGGGRLVNILETGSSCLGKGSAGKVFFPPECEILQNLRPAEYVMPLTPSILFPNANRRTRALRLPPLRASIQPGRAGGDIGPVAKAVFSAPAPARSI